MNRFRNPRIILLLIVSLALLSAEIERIIPHSLKHTLQSGQPANILLLGVDARPGEITARSDTIILMSIDNKLKKAVLVWIPRDTRIYTASPSQKINMVNQLKGPKACCKEVEKLMAVPVNHYVLTNFTGFERIIDILGGVYLDVDINLASPSSGVYLKKGFHRLNGKEALKYVRYRGRIDGDIGRTARQQKLLRALSRQLLQAETIPKIPGIIQELRNNVYTNISLNDMVYMANIVLQINEHNIVTQTLPGYAYTDPYSGASYWEVDRQTAASLLQSLFHGETFDVDLKDPQK